MDRFSVDNKNLEGFFEDDFQVAPTENQETWYYTDYLWGALGYETQSNKKTEVVPVSSRRFPKVDIGDYGLTLNETQIQAMKIGVEKPYTKEEFLMNKVRDFFGKDYVMSKEVVDLLNIVLKDPKVCEELDGFLVKATQIRLENQNKIEGKQEIDFLNNTMMLDQLFFPAFEQMLNVIGKHVEVEVSRANLGVEESKKHSHELNCKLNKVLSFFKVHLVNKASLMNSQWITDVIDSAPYKLDLEKPEQEREYFKVGNLSKVNRFYNSHTSIAGKYSTLSVEEKMLFDEKYELRAEDNLWAKSYWEKPSASRPMVYTFHFGLAQPHGDIREGSIQFDLSALKLPPLSQKEEAILFNYFAEATCVANDEDFEKIFHKHKGSLMSINGLGDQEAQGIKWEVKKFWKQIDPLIFSAYSNLGHTVSSSHFTVSRREEMLARANLMKLIQARGLYFDKHVISSTAPAFKIPEFRLAFQEFVEIVAKKMGENQFPPYGEDRMGLDKKMTAMREVLKKNDPKLLEAVAPVLERLYTSLITGANN